MWVHECHRVYRDRLLFPEDLEGYVKFLQSGIKEFTDQKEDEVLAEPIIFTSFVTACEGHESAYMYIRDMDHLKGVLESKLEEYNENVQSMDLVLFNEAMEHITRISRIIDQPGGNGILVGVGGSGKQSLSKLSAFILSYDIFRIMVSTNYSMVDLKTDI